ncbi:hypothetical protein GVV04_04005 [Micromonospora sp. NEAU-HG-1]|nr:hypothetical protein [Micromonospora rubida]
MSLLDTVDQPDDHRRRPTHDQLRPLAGEIRAFLVEAICRRVGHLGPNLGVVELTIAPHRVFGPSRDRIIFDTGHQANVPKPLTGRRTGFAQLLGSGGLAGHPRRAESPHDLSENSGHPGARPGRDHRPGRAEPSRHRDLAVPGPAGGRPARCRLAPRGTAGGGRVHRDAPPVGAAGQPGARRAGRRPCPGPHRRGRSSRGWGEHRRSTGPRRRHRRYAGARPRSATAFAPHGDRAGLSAEYGLEAHGMCVDALRRLSWLGTGSRVASRRVWASVWGGLTQPAG